MDLPVNYHEISQPERRAVREEYARIQEGLCCHCKEPLSGLPTAEIQGKHINLKLFPKDFLKWPVHLHHDHKTQMTIGAVHARCNAVLWEYYGE
jgi:hypothetical protein